MNSCLTLLAFYLSLQGCASFTVPISHDLSRRISLVQKPFHLITELKSDVQDVSEAVSGGESDSESDSNKPVAKVRNTAFIGNLAFELNDEEIGDMCKQFGKVLFVNVPKNRSTGQPRGFAFVDMSTPEELEALVKGLDGTPVKGRILRATISDPSQKQEKPEKKPFENGKSSGAKIYVGNLPFGATKEQLLEFYGQFCQPIEAYIPVNEATGTGRGFAFVTLKEEDVESVIEKTNGRDYEGRPLVVSRPLPPGQRSNRRPPARERTKLYIGNLAFNTDVGILEEVFGEFGEVFDCYMPEDPAKGGSRGFGFVTMARENAMEAIAELNGCELDGRSIRVNEAVPKGRMDDDGGY